MINDKSVNDLPSCEPKKKYYPPCRFACPANVNVQAYASLISQGRFDEALEVIRKAIPFPAVCGRVCFSPCEEACVRNKIDSPVGIRLLKRLVSDREYASERASRASPFPRVHDEKVAIIGSGPAGLTAAYELVRMGYNVTVFEKEEELGGMLRSCIPRYRLPEDVLNAEIKYIIDSGVVVRRGVKIGEGLPFDDLWAMGFKAVFIATGAPKCHRLGVEGEDLKGVMHALEFLKEAHDDGFALRGRVAVIGGGNVAIDAARTVVRLGPDEVTVVYRRVKEDMPALPKEVEEAKIEGVKFQYLATPSRILGDGDAVKALECIRIRLAEPYDSGRRRPIPIQGSEFIIPVHHVIIAVGETTDIAFLPSEVEVTKWNIIVVDPTTHTTNVPGIFAGGDVVTGPASVIDAIASGKKAARAMDLYLRGESLEVLKEEKPEEKGWVKDASGLAQKNPQKVISLPVHQRLSNFNEVEMGLTGMQGVLESLRCLHCGPCSECLANEDLCETDTAEVIEKKCTGCGTCVTICPFDAITKDSKGIARVDEASCKGCGICASSCPERAINMRKFNDELLLDAAVGI